MTHARFIGFDQDQAALFASLAGFSQAQIGNAPGDFIPNAPAVVASASITRTSHSPRRTSSRGL